MEQCFDYIDGCYLPKAFLEIKNEILNMEVRDSDVWVCTFPKSGTTWVQEAVWLLCNQLNFAKAKTEIVSSRMPYLEVSALPGAWKFEQNYFPDDDSCVSYLKKRKERRFIKTHLPWNLLPKQIQNKQKNPKIIYVTRNPKDAVISGFHHFSNASGNKEFKTYFNNFLQNKGIYTPYWDHIWSYDNNKDIPNMLILKYEDMKNDLKSEIIKLAEFLEVTQLGEADLVALLNHLSFDSMRGNRMVNYSHIFDELKKDKICDKNFCFVRAGNAGGYKSVLSAEMKETIDRWIKDNLAERNVEYGELIVNCNV